MEPSKAGTAASSPLFVCSGATVVSQRRPSNCNVEMSFNGIRTRLKKYKRFKYDSLPSYFSLLWNNRKHGAGVLNEKRLGQSSSREMLVPTRIIFCMYVSLTLGNCGQISMRKWSRIHHSRCCRRSYESESRKADQLQQARSLPQALQLTTQPEAERGTPALLKACLRGWKGCRGVNRDPSSTRAWCTGKA